jgi:lipoprotein-anchoring transpeptidase ErfK/SrfK
MSAGRWVGWTTGVVAAVAVAAVGGAVAASYLVAVPADAGELRPAAERVVPPTGSASPTPTPTAPAHGVQAVVSRPGTGTCARTAAGQLTLERYLATNAQYGPVTVDGRQDAADCAAIRKFQSRYGIRPANGVAGPLTTRVATRLGRAALGRCKTGPALIICVDLTSQTMWVVKNGEVVLGPTVIRTGRAGLATPAGHYRIADRGRRYLSKEFKVILPYWQRFNGGMGFHETTTYLHDGDSPGSHGCVNLLHRDAVALWGLTGHGTPVHIFGQKPGT